MSWKIEENKITLTRGDTFQATVGITIDEEPYTPASGDSVRFALKRAALNYNRTDFMDEEPLILKEIPTDTMLLELDPEDTKSLGFGRYVYDVEITFADGTVNTFITAEDFILAEEVE